MTEPSTPPLPPGLYVVATPIGNLGDMTPRGIDMLQRCSVIACEDTRVTAVLARRFHIRTPLIPYHDHNADQQRPALIARAGREPVALVSDAGTPLISDPGCKLVRDARAAGVTVTTAPGPCAAIAALSLAGLPTNQFFFAGFLPPRAAARRALLRQLAVIPATLVFYESAPRLGEALADMQAQLGPRPACIAREITKLHETLYDGPLDALAARFAEETVKGELVIVVAAQDDALQPVLPDVDALLRAALEATSLKQAVADVTASTGLPRKQVYARALALQGDA